MARKMRTIIIVGITVMVALTLSLCAVFAEGEADPVYEDNPDGTVTLVKWSTLTDIDYVRLPDETEDGKLITGIRAGAFQDLVPQADTLELILPNQLKHVDEAFLAGSEVTAIRIPAYLEGKHILDGSKVGYIEFLTGREVLPGDLLYSEPAPPEEYDWEDPPEEPVEEEKLGRYCLEEVTFNWDLKEIGAKAFYQCSSLTTTHYMDYGDEKTLGEYIFSGCESLQSIGCYTSCIPEGMFENCYALEYVGIDCEESVAISDYAFFNCSNLKELELPEKVNYIGESAFCRCQSLTTLSLPDTDLGEHAFWYDTGLTSVTMATDPEKEGHAVIGKGAFSGCNNMTSIQLSDRVDTIPESAFQSCSKLNSIDLSHIRSIGLYAFDGCKGFTGTLRVPAVEIGNVAFRGCTSITGLEFYKTSGTGSSWSIGEAAFTRCTSLAAITFTDGLASIGDRAFYSTGLLNPVLPAGSYSIGDSAFGNCTSMTTVDLSAANPVLGNHVFTGDKVLTKVTFPETVRGMGESVFVNCYKLQTVNIPGGISEIPKNTFNCCWALMFVTVPEGVTVIRENAFFDCIKLWSITLPDSLKTIEKKAFALCLDLKAVNFGNGLTTIGESCFENCAYNLTGIILPESVREIGDFAFKDCVKLVQLEIPEGIRTIGAGILYNTAVTHFDMYPGVTYRTGTYTSFTGCETKPEGELGPLSGSNVTNINVYEGVTKIPDRFYSNEELDEGMVIVEVFGPGVSVGSNAFKNAGTMAFSLNFRGGLPSYIASDAFATDDLAETLDGFCCNYDPDVPDWGDFPNHNYGRIIHWVNGMKETPEGLNFCMEGKTLIVYNNGSGLVDIPDHGIEEAYPWADEADKADKIVILRGVRTIGSYAFYGSKAREINVGSSVKEIHEWAFRSTNLKIVVFHGNCPTFADEVFLPSAQITCYYPQFNTTWDHVHPMACKLGEQEEYHYGADQIFWEEFTPFKLYRDNNSMGNDLKNFDGHYYTYHVDRIVAACSKSAEKTKLRNQSVSREDIGICFGLSATMMMHLDGSLSQVFDEDIPYWELENDANFKAVVKYYQLIQEAPSLLVPTAITFNGKKNRDYVKHVVSHSEFLRKLVEEATRYSSLDGVCLLRYSHNQGGNHSYHIVVCCGCEYGDFDGDGSNEYAIKMYDCNTSDNNSIPTKYLYMFVGADYSWFTFRDANIIIENMSSLEDTWTHMMLYTLYDFTKPEITLPAIPTSEKTTSAEKRGKSMQSEEGQGSGDESEAGKISIAIPSSQAYTLRNAAGQTLVSDGEDIDGDMPILEGRIAVEEPSLIIDTDPSDSFEASDFSDDFEFIAEVDGLSYLAKVSGADSILISKDNGVKITGDGVSEYTVAVTDLAHNNAYTQVSGSSQGDVEFSLKDQKINIKGEGDLSNLQIISAQGTTVKERDIEVSGDELTFGLNKDGEIKTKEELEEEEQNSGQDGSDKDAVKPVKVSKIALSGISKNIAQGKSITLSASVSPANAANKKVVWSSSNTKVATVNQAGKVTTGKKAGGKSVTITAKAADGSGVKATYKIKVMKGKVKKLTISGKKKVKAGKSLKLKAKVKAEKGANKKVKWTSSNVKYATVSGSGKVKANKSAKGKTVTITAMTTDGTNIKKKIKIKIG